MTKIRSLVWAISVLVWSTNACAGAITVEVREDSGAGVEANVYFSVPGEPAYLAATSAPDGVAMLDLKYECRIGATLFAEPKSKNYFDRTGLSACNSDRVIKLIATRRNKMQEIQRTAESYERAGQYGPAGQAFLELYARTGDNTFFESGMENTARALNVETALVYDKRQQQKVASPELVSAVKDLQKENDIKETGSLNARTMYEIAGGSVGTNVLYAVETFDTASPP